MKVKELIKELQQIKDKEKELEILIGDDDNDYYTCSDFILMHTLDDDEQKMMVDKKIRSILNMPISQEAKQKTIDNFFGNIDVPGFTNQEDYFKNLII